MNTALPALANVPTFPGGQAVTTPVVRVMSALGSRQFTANFMLLQARLNNMKDGVSFSVLLIPLPHLNDASRAKAQNSSVVLTYHFLVHERGRPCSSDCNVKRNGRQPPPFLDPYPHCKQGHARIFEGTPDAAPRLAGACKTKSR